MIKGIHHVAFKCETQEQYDEMIYFYHELLEILYLIFNYPHKHYTFKHFEV